MRARIARAASMLDVVLDRGVPLLVGVFVAAVVGLGIAAGMGAFDPPQEAACTITHTAAGAPVCQPNR